MKNSQITFLQNFRAPDQFCSTTTLDAALKSIKDKTYKIQIDYIRTLTDKDALNAAKLKLPCVIFTGTFTDITTHENLTTTSGVVVMDIDELPKDSTLEEVKQRICALPYVIFCFLSPTSRGFKVGVRVDPGAVPVTYGLKEDQQRQAKEKFHKTLGVYPG